MFLRLEVGSAAQYRTMHPQLFKGLHEKWTRAQIDYLDAVIRGDAAAAHASLQDTPFWLGLADAMETDDGTALLAS